MSYYHTDLEIELMHELIESRISYDMMSLEQSGDELGHTTFFYNRETGRLLVNACGEPGDWHCSTAVYSFYYSAFQIATQVLKEFGLYEQE